MNFHKPPGGRESQAFTLIELLAVACVLCLLAAVLATAMARTAPNSPAMQCLNNYRRLGAAFSMYAEDNRGRLVYNHDGAQTGKVAGSEAWVGGWMDYTTASDNTNTDLLINHERYPFGAFFGPYLKTPGPFKCPADKSSVLMAGQRMPRVRSVSMSNRVGQGSRSWSSFTSYQMYSKIADFSQPPPSQIFVFLDEHPDSINDGWFVTDPDTQWQLIDYPAAYHNGGCGFGFADGHSEIHRWKDKRTMPILGPGQILPLNVTLPGDVDLQWLQQHAAGRR